MTAGLARGLTALARASVARPRTVLVTAVLIAAAALAGAAGHLELRTSNLDLVSPDLPPVRAFRELARELGTPNALVVVLAGDDERALRAAVDELGPRLAAVPGTRSVFGRLPVPAVPLPFGAAPAFDPYLASRDRGLFFLFVQPADAESRAETIAPWVAGVRVVLGGADLAADGVTWGLTGIPQYALDDRQAVERDLRLLSPVSFALVLALFAGAFGALRRPLAAMAALLLAVAAAVGIAALWPGYLTLLSAFFASILFGLGVDYGIHVVDRTEELRGRVDDPGAGGHGERAAEALAVEEAVAGLAPALATGAVTSVSAFLALTLSGFRGFAELGWIAAAGLAVALLAMATALPALLVLAPGRPPRRGSGRRRHDRIGAVLLRLQRPGLAAVLGAAAILGPLVARPTFDPDYLNLEPRGSEAVRWEREMVARSRFSPQFAAFLTDSPAEAAGLVRRLRAEETVGEVHRAGDRAVYAHPAGDVWDPAVRDRFLDRMAALDPDVTGMPVLGRFMIERSHRALRIAGLLGAAAIFFWVLADLRDPRLALLAVLPTVLGLGATTAVMRVLGIPFNPLNVMALPVVIGIAVDDGVHLVHRYRAEGGDLEATLLGTGRSVVLTSATSLAAFGSLAFASHRGLASFAWVLSLGVAAALLLSVLVLPQALVRWAPRATPEAAPCNMPPGPRFTTAPGAPCPCPDPPPSDRPPDAPRAALGASGSSSPSTSAAWWRRRW